MDIFDKNIPFEKRSRYFASLKYHPNLAPLSILIDSIQYRNWQNKKDLARYSEWLFWKMVANFNFFRYSIDLVAKKCITTWPEEFIRKYWELNDAFKLWSLLSGNCPVDLLEEAFRNGKKFTCLYFLEEPAELFKMFVLWHPKCPSLIRLVSQMDYFENLKTFDYKKKLYIRGADKSRRISKIFERTACPFEEIQP